MHPVGRRDRHTVFRFDSRSHALVPNTQYSCHRRGIHDAEVLVAVVEDDIRALDTLSSELFQVVCHSLKLALRVQIFEALSRRDVALEPVLSVLAMKSQVDLGRRSLR